MYIYSKHRQVFILLLSMDLVLIINFLKSEERLDLSKKKTEIHSTVNYTAILITHGKIFNPTLIEQWKY